MMLLAWKTKQHKGQLKDQALPGQLETTPKQLQQNVLSSLCFSTTTYFMLFYLTASQEANFLWLQIHWQKLHTTTKSHGFGGGWKSVCLNN